MRYRALARTVVLLLLPFRVATAGAQAPNAGPNPGLVGTWESESLSNKYVINVSWNPSAGRYEGRLIRHGEQSARSGLAVGDIGWIATPAPGRPILEGAVALYATAPGQPPGAQWRRHAVQLDLRDPQVLHTGATRLHRFVPGATPRTPAAPAAEQPPSGGLPKSVKPIVFDKPVCSANATAYATSVRPGASVAGLRLGMTRDEALAVCCARAKVSVREIWTAVHKTGQEVDPKTDPKQLLEPAYLSGISCSGQGTIDVRFSPPPGPPRVITVIQQDWSGDTVPITRQSYLDGLTARYGKPTARADIEPIDPARGSSAVTYKWLFRKGRDEIDCTPLTTSRISFSGALTGPGRCATRIVVRVAADEHRIFAADLSLLNLTDLVEAQDGRTAYLNKKYGLTLPEGAMAATFRREPGGQDDPDKRARAAAQAVAKATAAAISRSQGSFGDGVRDLNVPPPPPSKSSETYYEKMARQHDECVAACDRQRGTGCAFGSGEGAQERYQACANDSVSSCKMSCPTP